jgi:hypothetical protein
MDESNDWPDDWTGSAPVPVGVDEAFNGYMAAHVIFALDRLGIIDELTRPGSVGVADLTAARGGADPRMLAALLAAAAACGYLRLQDGSVSLTKAGEQMATMRGYFTWAVGGYAGVFADLAGIIAGERRFRRDVFRDEGMVALGSAQNDRALMGGTLDNLLARLDFGMIADLGSGTSARVCRIARRHDGVRAVGLDISADATRLAHENIREAGLSARVRARQADVADLIRQRAPDAALAEVDTVMSFFLLHDLLAAPMEMRSVIPGLRAVFPGARTFLLADTVIAPAAENGSPTLPVFSVGYELAHALMGIPLHTRAAYEALFRDAGLRIREVVPFGTPHSWLFVLGAE